MVIFDKSLPLIFISGWLWHSIALVTVAQIDPDTSLGQETSIVTPDVVVKDAIADYLEGGAIRGNNLFHSFTEFNIPELERVYFASPEGIDNILTRITGNNVSQIFGTLGVDGNANLFLLNPNGIVFGQNAQLDLAGSLLVTTADSYIFDNGFNFSAVDGEIPPLLTINIPVGLQFGSNPGQIINRSHSTTSISRITDPDDFITPEGLRIAPGQNLSLLGGEIKLEAGYLNTSTGKIELGAVGANQKIKLNPDHDNWQLDYQEVSNFADIKINQQGGIDGGTEGKTQIYLTGKNISLGYDFDTLAEFDFQIEDFFSPQSLPELEKLPANHTRISAQNQDHEIPVAIDINASDTFSIIDPGRNQSSILAHTSGTGDAGIIDIVADSIIIYGANLESWTLPQAAGNSGEINFTAQNMSVQNGGGGVNTFSGGNGGTIYLDIANTAQIKFGGLGAEARSSGSGGTVKVEAQNLEIISGGIGTSTFGTGDGGTIDLNIAHNLTVISGGFGSDAFAAGDGGKIEIAANNIELFNAGMGARTIGSGNGGKIEIDAETIVFQDGVINAESGQNFDERDFPDADSRIIGDTNAGNGGSISIKAQSLLIDNGNITTSTFGTGEAGNITLKVNSLSAVSGDLVTGVHSSTQGSGRGGDITVTGDRLVLQNDSAVAADSEGQGAAGDIKINTTELIRLEDRSTISVNGGNLGIPGDIEAQSTEISLNQAAAISATSTQGEQGNINLSADNLWLRDRSQIITNAIQDATGGNIFIDLTHSLLALDKSQIVANAEQGQGGQIQISATGIFVDSKSTINASSEFGVDGLVQINNLAVDPDSSLIPLPTKTIDPSKFLSHSCHPQDDDHFANVGQGGLPANPLQDLIDHTLLPDWSRHPQKVNQSSKLGGSNYQFSSPNPSFITEAQGWEINHNGKLELVASSGHHNWNQIDNPDCLGN
ncbi:MAG: S-layer family protein [Cyanobacteria bacterium P01_E01_bin.35]